MQLLVCWENLHVGEQSLERLLIDEGLAIRHSLEGCLQIHQLLSSEHLFDGDVLHSEVGSVLLCFLHCLFEQTSWVSQAQLWHTWKFVRVLKVRLFVHFFGIFVVDFSVDASLWLVLDPLANKELVLGVVEVTALAFALVTNPVTFEVIAVTLCQNTVTIALSLVPLAFVDVFVGVDHATLSLGQPIHPVAIVTIPIFIEKGSSSVLFIFVPVARVFTTQFVTFVLPVSTLAVAFVNSPHAFILVFVFVKLNTETLLAVIAPVANVLLRGLPLLSLDGSVF